MGENPSAFPFQREHPIRGGGSYRDDHPGMTLRDWFAGQALSGIILAVSAGQHHPGNGLGGGTIDDKIAADAFALADAMLAARTEGKSHD